MDKDKKKDVTYSVAKAGIGSIPIIGAAASELFSLIVTPPLEKRRTEWIEDIGIRIKTLEDRDEISVESLRENDTFIDVVLQTTHQALKTSQQEKLDCYKNAIINTAVGEHPEISEIQIFLNLISDYTVWHIKILKLFDNPSDWFESHSIPAPNFMSASLSSIIEIAFPELKRKGDLYDLIWDDLKRAGLHKSGSLRTMMTGSGLMTPRTSFLGKRFLNFISEHE
jgi:hypothetical protein